MSVPVMFMEKDVGEILRASNSETIATTSTTNVSHGSSRDGLKKKTSVTWTWKNKDKHVKPKTPIQGSTSESGKEAVG